MSDTPKVYRIAGWNETYETAESRKLKHLFWVPTPNKHDGLGFRRLAMHRNRCELFAAWILMVQLASKGPPERRGLLTRDSKPLDAEEMSLMTGFPVSIFEGALAFFSDPKLGWLVHDSPADTPASTAEAERKPGKSPDAPAHPAGPSGQSPGASGESADTGRQVWNTGSEVVSSGPATTTPLPQEEDTDEAWLARLQVAHPQIDVRAEADKALKKLNGEAFERTWFEKNWLPHCSKKFGRNRKRAESAPKTEPKGWRTWWRGKHPDESQPLPKSFADLPQQEQSAAWMELAGNDGKAA